MSNISIIIPARQASTRFHNKPLALINGVPMIIRVADGCAPAFGKENVYVATDSYEIGDKVADAGYKVIMALSTLGNFNTGTDRVAYAAKQLDSYFIINVQGDEPLVDYHDLIEVYEAMKVTPLTIYNLYSTCNKYEAQSVNTIKVVTDDYGKALYMSRMRIPFWADVYKKQVGVYGYTKPYLTSNFGENIPKGKLEKQENIEIMRMVGGGAHVHMLETKNKYQSVDTKGDIPKVEAILNER